MAPLDPLLNLKEELDDAARRETGWLRLALALARDKAPAHVVDEAYRNHQLTGDRRRQLVRHLGASLLSQL